MAKLAIVATAEIAAGRIHEVLPVLMAHRERCLRDEPGTLQFEVLRPEGDDSKIMIYEVYSDDAAFQAHWNGPSMKQAREEAKDMILSLSGVRCKLVE